MYTIDQYVAALDRELRRREAAYPKMVSKRKKEQYQVALSNGATREEADTFAAIEGRRIMNDLQAQCFQIVLCSNALLGQELEREDHEKILAELKRELKMSRKHYSWFIFKKIMTTDEAQAEKSVWTALVNFYTTKFDLP